MRLLRLISFLIALLISTLFVSAQDQPSPEQIPTVSVSVSGNVIIPAAELVESFKACGTGSWQTFADRKYEFFAAKCVRNTMFAQGFWQAEIVDIVMTVKDGKRHVNVAVKEGTRYRLGEVKIGGNRLIPTKEIVDMLGLRSGEIADGAVFQEALFVKLQERYNERGYIQFEAEFNPSFVAPPRDGMDGIVNVAVEIDEGPQFRVGTINFNSAEDKKLPISDFALNSGEIYSGRKLKNAVDKLNASGSFGRIDPERDVRIFTDEKAASVDLVVVVRSHR